MLSRFCSDGRQEYNTRGLAPRLQLGHWSRSLLAWQDWRQINTPSLRFWFCCKLGSLISVLSNQIWTWVEAHEREGVRWTPGRTGRWSKVEPWSKHHALIDCLLAFATLVLCPEERLVCPCHFSFCGENNYRQDLTSETFLQWSGRPGEDFHRLLRAISCCKTIPFGP